jgi:hypothetical protein
MYELFIDCLIDTTCMGLQKGLAEQLSRGFARDSQLPSENQIQRLESTS